MNQSTERLTTNLTTLKEKCIEFTQTAQSLSAARRLTSLALSRHTQLLEILELPQLMDTCVRNGYYEEALDLASYVSRLERKLAYIPLITVRTIEHEPFFHLMCKLALKCVIFIIESSTGGAVLHSVDAKSTDSSTTNASAASPLS